MRHGQGHMISNSSTLNLTTSSESENEEVVIPFPHEYFGSWSQDKKHGKGTIYINSKAKNGIEIKKEIEGTWEADRFKFDEIVKVTIREISSGKVISTFEGLIDERYNPIMHS